MRFRYMLFLLALLIVIGIFAWENRATTSVQLLQWQVAGPLALVVTAVYFLGILSGSFLISMLRRSDRDESNPPR